jgi:hypothetical protein
VPPTGREASNQKFVFDQHAHKSISPSYINKQQKPKHKRQQTKNKKNNKEQKEKENKKTDKKSFICQRKENGEECAVIFKGNESCVTRSEHWASCASSAQSLQVALSVCIKGTAGRVRAKRLASRASDTTITMHPTAPERLHPPARRRGGTIGWLLLCPAQQLCRSQTCSPS